MAVHLTQSLPHHRHQLHLMQQYRIETANVLLNVAPRLIYLMEQSHFLLYEVDYVVDVLSVGVDELFFFLEDEFDEFFVVVAEAF